MTNICTRRIQAILLATALSIVSTVYSAVHFVSLNGTASWAQSISSNTPCALATANSNAAAGDTVNLLGGTYSATYINPSKSGTAGSPILFQNYNSQTVTITNADYAIYIDGKAYIEVRGIDFNNLLHFFYIRNRASHNTISYCTFDQCKDTSVWNGARIYESSQSNYIHHCTFSRWGYISPVRQFGALLDIGTESVLGDSSYYNRIEDNTLYFGGHHCLAVWTKFCMIRNNYIHNEAWPNNEGYRGIITNGLECGYNLYEGNRFAFADSSSGVSLRSGNNIFRHNAFYGNGSGGMQIVSMTSYGHTPANDNRIYNNVFFRNGHSMSYSGFQGGIYLADWGDGDPTGNVIKNNIFFDNKGPALTFDGVSDPQIFENNWTGGDPFFINDESPLTPANPGLPDFHLQSTSKCIDSGVSLTKITSPSGSGTQFLVADAGYFTDGWGMIQGDLVQLEGETQKVRITRVDYAAKRITVASSISWQQNKSIGLAYLGTAPEIGAHEYGLGTSVTPPLPKTPADRGALSYSVYNSPNSLGVKFVLPAEAFVTLSVYDITGKQIRTLLSGGQKAGRHSVSFYTKDWPSGVHLVRLEAGNFSDVRKIVTML